MTAFVTSQNCLTIQHRGAVLSSVTVPQERRKELHAYAKDQLRHFQVHGDSPIAWMTRQTWADCLAADVRAMVAGTIAA